MSNAQVIGIAGTGKMGAAMTKRLLAQGCKVVVWNRSASRAQPLLTAGAQWAESPKLLAQMCDLVISILTDEAAIDEVYSGSNGLLAGAKSNQLIVDMSTVRPAKPKAIAALTKTVGAKFLECPVGGSVGPALEGKLLGFVGGEDSDVERAREILNLLCRRIEHVGPHGAGATMKLAINLPLMVYWQTLSEALSLLEPLHLDPARVVDILSETSGGPNMLKVRGPMIAKALSGATDGAVSVDLLTMRKDLRSMVAQAAEGNYKVPLASLTLASIERAVEQGLADADCTQLPVWWLGNGGKI